MASDKEIVKAPVLQNGITDKKKAKIRKTIAAKMDNSNLPQELKEYILNQEEQEKRP